MNLFDLSVGCVVVVNDKKYKIMSFTMREKKFRGSVIHCDMFSVDGEKLSLTHNFDVKKVNGTYMVVV